MRPDSSNLINPGKCVVGGGLIAKLVVLNKTRGL